MNKKAIPEAAEMLEKAYIDFLNVYQALRGGRTEGNLNNPVVEKQFDRLDKYFMELMDSLNAAAHRFPFSGSAARPKSEQQ
ncbi:MAG TPA: hypothetical protein VK829_19060 [Terriglobales bacterium]|jgi:hypothetical protein|nr:hypothetical protein [Terriglobales bacterium]